METYIFIFHFYDIFIVSFTRDTITNKRITEYDIVGNYSGEDYYNNVRRKKYVYMLVKGDHKGPFELYERYSFPVVEKFDSWDDAHKALHSLNWREWDYYDIICDSYYED